MPHGHCFFWRPELVWLHAGSDVLIAAAYYSIPFTLFYVARRRAIQMRHLILMFAAFILACGTTHLMAVWNLWNSAYRLEGVVKAITAVLSVSTAIVTVKLVPVALGMPTAADLQQVNEFLRQEIEARTKAEEKLWMMVHSERVDSEAKIRSFFEAASQAIIAVSSAGKMVLVNRATEEMFGYDRSELLGQDLSLLIPERYREAHTKHVAGYFANPRLRPVGGGIELWARRKDGTEFPVEIGLSHVDTGDGPLALGLVSDITERKRSEDQLERAIEELRRSNAELEQFAYIASHDLQEPLRMITGYLNILQRRYSGRLDGDAEEFIRYAVDGATRMKTMIREILSLSRVGTQAVNRMNVGAGEVVQAAIDNLAAAIEESSARITIDPLPTIYADPGLLSLVFQNLIGNAIKFRGEKRPEIHIEGNSRGRECVISIRDNGIGMQPEHLSRIFLMFERLHSNEEYPGTGVGLAVAKKVVERHNGRLWAQSKPGEGSIFFISLPNPDLSWQNFREM